MPWETGPELNLEIAKKIDNLSDAGWYRRQSYRNTVWEACGPTDVTTDVPPGRQKWPAIAGWKDEYGYVRTVPDYSGDMTTAWKLLKRFNDRHQTTAMLHVYPHDDDGISLFLDADPDAWLAYAAYDDMPLNICVAILKAQQKMQDAFVDVDAVA